jgi:prepilin-type N-terminal cleavage/methylation domain-containing protein
MSRRARGNTQNGFTLIEVVIAIFLLMLGSLTILSLVDASTRNNYRVEQSQVTVNQLEAELERIKRLPFNEVALTGTPASSADQDNPAWRVSAGQFALERDGTDLRPLVVNGAALEGGGTVSGGTLSAAPTPFQSGDIGGTIRRYVVWVNDTRCPETVCPGSQDIKRVVVAATLDSTAPGGDRAYQELQTDLVDPEATPVDDAVPDGDGDTDGDGVPDGDEEGSFATFFLTDTPCNQTERQPLTGDHNTHNTLGTCSNGMQTGDTKGSADLMFTDPPKLDAAFPADQQPLYDYSTDVEPAVGAENDKGLQIRHSNLTGCIFSPTLTDGVPSQKVHRWLTPPIPDDFELLLDGEATLSLWTRTLNGGEHPGRICVFLYARKTNLLGVPVDVLMANEEITDALWFPHEEETWPRANWTELNIDMNFLYAAGSLLEGERLGLAISVEKNGTNPGDGLEFMYDHPSFDSRLQIKTSSILPAFE